MLDLVQLESRIKELAAEAEQAAVRHHSIVGAITELRQLYINEVEEQKKTAIPEIKVKSK